ncbi:hypothetical protein CPB84DRAFT_1846215 [Gymnopilus junonius]|uniref:DUF6534 domain-containing protein n=1 Tax=Gymnopilus junonius TaxID=109634 RepID=A0A9P5NQ30_GYMJU|nr:hypothetical protein CPB84DRAFT_1846215 [Gymnopilus junonius]
MSALPPIPPDIGRIAGPLLIGYLLNWGLEGVLSMQVYMYYLAFPQDPLSNKLLAYGIFIFETVQTILLTQTAFRSFAAGFGNLGALDRIGLIWFYRSYHEWNCCFCRSIFYAYRIRILSQTKTASIIIIVLAFVQLGGAIATGVESKKAVFTSKFLRRTSLITTGIWNGGSALCDIIIAGCMTYYVCPSPAGSKNTTNLFKLWRRGTGMKHTQRLIRRLIRLIVETGSLTAAIALLNFILALLPGQPTYYQTTAGVLGKMYSNAMMVVFNSRLKLSYETSTVHEMSLSYRRNPLASDEEYQMERSAVQESTLVPTIQSNS